MLKNSLNSTVIKPRPHPRALIGAPSSTPFPVRLGGVYVNHSLFAIVRPRLLPLRGLDGLAPFHPSPMGITVVTHCSFDELSSAPPPCIDALSPTYFPNSITVVNHSLFARLSPASFLYTVCTDWLHYIPFLFYYGNSLIG